MDHIFWQVKNLAFLRNQWRSQSCESPLKQVYPLCQMYLDEHDGGPDREVPGDQRFLSNSHYKTIIFGLVCFSEFIILMDVHLFSWILENLDVTTLEEEL